MPAIKLTRSVHSNLVRSSGLGMTPAQASREIKGVSAALVTSWMAKGHSLIEQKSRGLPLGRLRKHQKLCIKLVEEWDEAAHKYDQGLHVSLLKSVQGDLVSVVTGYDANNNPIIVRKRIRPNPHAAMKMLGSRHPEDYGSGKAVRKRKKAGEIQMLGMDLSQFTSAELREMLTDAPEDVDA